MKAQILTIALFSYLFIGCDPMATATICNESKNEIFLYIDFDKNYLRERTDLNKSDIVNTNLPAIYVDTLNLKGKYIIMPDSCYIIEFTRGFRPWFNSYSSITVISGKDTLELNSKEEMKDAFKKEEDGYYLKITNKNSQF